MKLRFVPLLALLVLAACPDDDALPATQPDAGAPRADAEPPAPSCDDGIKNGEEGDVDCGGTCAERCSTWASCEQDGDCAANHVCKPSISDLGDTGASCHPRVESCAGKPCSEGEYCAQYGTDDSETGEFVMVYFCKRDSRGGEACAQHHDKDVNTCETDYRCQDYVCQLAPGLGEACDTSLGRQACNVNLVCNGGSCEAVSGPGEYCLNDPDCAVGFYCAGRLGGHCEPRTALGGVCDSDSCDVGTECGFPANLVCTDWIDCGSQMECCGTDDGSAECRVYDVFSETCAPPTGRCEIENYF